jgi:hypothetical protein
MIKPGEEIKVAVFVHRDVSLSSTRSSKTYRINRYRSSMGSRNTPNIKISGSFSRMAVKKINSTSPLWSKRSKAESYPSSHSETSLGRNEQLPLGSHPPKACQEAYQSPQHSLSRRGGIAPGVLQPRIYLWLRR